MRAPIWIPLLALAAWLAGCQNAPASPDALASQAPAEEFSGDAAFEHLRALAALGPRVSGTPAADEARTYLRGELEELGLVVEERRVDGPPGPDGVPLVLVNLMAVIPGASEQLFVLTAPYDTRGFQSFRFVGANAGASAAALLLELARVIQARPLPYTTWIVFLDREAPWADDPNPAADPVLGGSSVLAQELAAKYSRSFVRLIVSFQQVGDADLRVVRDLRSHRLFREEFWMAAARLGHQDAFRADDPFGSPPGSHLPFIASGFRGVVLITDPSYGGEEPPGAYANSEDDTPEHCSAESLATVGTVTLDALGQIGERLAKIDRYAKKAAPPPPQPAATEEPASEKPASEEPTSEEPAIAEPAPPAPPEP